MHGVFDSPVELPPLVVPDIWTCEKTGMRIPMRLKENLLYRQRLLKSCEGDEDVRETVFAACKESCSFFINAFCFTYSFFSSNEAGERIQSNDANLAFILWPIQQRFVSELIDSIDKGKDILCEKARDLGATTTVLAVLTWYFLFKEDFSAIVMSRREASVDVLSGLPTGYPYGRIADPGTLLGRIDYTLSRLPSWMLPELKRKRLQIYNATLNSRITGESSTASAGSGDRRTAIFMDEFSKMENAAEIKRSTRDVSACRIVVATANGAGTCFSEWAVSGAIPVFPMPWFEHPAKGIGRQVIAVNGRWEVTSPWLEQERKSRTPRELAIEVLCDHAGSAETYFDVVDLLRYRRDICTAPIRKVGISFDKTQSDARILWAVRTRNVKSVSVVPSGSWNLWCQLGSTGRPDQNRTYVFGVDISKGQGASNSVISVLCTETKEIIAQYANAEVMPHDLVKIAIAAAIWFGGKNRMPLIIPETNGDAGWVFIKLLVKTYNYPNVYRDRQAGTQAEKRGKRYGWRSSREKKSILLGAIRKAVCERTVKIRDEQTMVEAASYVYFIEGGIGPASLVKESESARKTHGDRLMAAALAYWGGMNEMNRTQVSRNRTPPEGSFAHRMFMHKAELKKKRDGKIMQLVGLGN